MEILFIMAMLSLYAQENTTLIGIVSGPGDSEIIALWKSTENVMSSITTPLENEGERVFIFNKSQIPKDVIPPILVRAKNMPLEAGVLVTEKTGDVFFVEELVTDPLVGADELRQKNNYIKNETLIFFGLESPDNGQWLPELIIRFTIMVVFLIIFYVAMIYSMNTKKTKKKTEMGEQMKIKNFMTQHILSIDENSSIKSAILLLVRHNLGSLVVTRKDGPIGIITERDLFKKKVVLSNKSDKVLKYMSSNLVMAKPDDPVFDVQKIMLENKIRRVPIAENGKIIGIVTASDLLGMWNDATETEVIKHLKIPDKRLKVHHWITTELIEMDLYDTLFDAYDLMNKNNVSDVIVMDGQQITGIVTERDIVTRFLLHKVNLRKTVIKDILKRRIITIEPDVELFEAAKIMAKNHIRRLPVVEDGKLLGIITATDIVKGWANIAKLTFI